MTDQLIGAVLGAVRMALVIAALVVALVPIGRSTITGFCPTVEPTNGEGVQDPLPGGGAGGPGDGTTGSGEDGGGTDGDTGGGGDNGDGGGGGTDAAPGEGVVLASTSGRSTLAQGTEDAATEGSTDGGTAPEDGATTPAEGVSPSEQPVDPCGPDVERCLPPLLSAVLVFGDGSCSDEAVSILRSRMLPAFGIASVLLGGAWVLRPRDGAALFSRE